MKQNMIFASSAGDMKSEIEYILGTTIFMDMNVQSSVEWFYWV